MADTLRLARYREPLDLSVRQGSRIAAKPDLRIQEIAFTSRGDRATGCVVLPAEGGGPHPLLLVQHAIGGSAADWIEPAATAWTPAGAVVAAVDFPLHGERADRKLLRWLLAEDRDRPDPRRGALALEFARQCVIDAERALDALTGLAWIDPERIAYVGFGLGAQVGSAFCALDPRPSAVVLAPGRDVLVTGELDPRENARRIAPRPMLWLRGPGDPDGAPESCGAEVAAVEADIGSPSAAALAAIGPFLSRTLAF